MTDRDELTELEAERDRLRTMIALYEHPDIGFPELPLWLQRVLVGAGGGVAALVGIWMLAGEIDPWLVIFLVVFLSLTAYISTRKINAFGTSVRIFDLLSYLALAASPTPGAGELRDRLSNCEARIMQLRERRPRAT
ncbi:MAG: hypothetical protein JO141_09840 [Bradyrhizobium sp.]|nr:hypothetical protein [Bradyrhizobium sp.]